MKLICPKCRHKLPPDAINVSIDAAFCANCSEAYKLSELIEAGGEDTGDIGDPPPGAWFRAEIDGWEVGATTRSGAALFLVPFICVWSGFAIGGIYGTQIVKGKFDLFQSLFGIPFLLGTAIFGSLALMTVCGKVRIRVRNDQAETFIGVGSIGFRKRFLWSSVQKISEGMPSARFPGQQSPGICIDDGRRPIHVGSQVREDRRIFIIRVLRRMLNQTGTLLTANRV